MGLAYLMALAELVSAEIFDFEEETIKLEGLYNGWQTQSSQKAIRLMGLTNCSE